MERSKKEMKTARKYEGNSGMSKESTRKSGNIFVSLTFQLLIDSRAI